LTAIAIIPARFGSTRFPGKIVAADTGKPLVQHVVERARLARRVRDVIVATDDQRIVDCLRPFGTKCVMTSSAHASGTDRLAEVAKGISDQIVVNVQGDEPEIESSTIDALVERLEHGDEEMATAATEFGADGDVNDPNLAKLVMDYNGRAIYFSRLAIPYNRDSINGMSSTSTSRPTYYLHQGIYAYRREFLLKFASWPPSDLEQAEKLEQLRALEHGAAIYVVKTRRSVHGIDTREQYESFVKRYKAAIKGQEPAIAGKL
jgi:3-deoxy-manno-octulosonate cytidylyltransferase (CMP-KDO synthetase)